VEGRARPGRPGYGGIAAGVVISGHPPGIRRIPAQRLARQELARSIYRPSLVQRVTAAVMRWLNRLFSGNGHVPVGGLVVVAVVAVAALAWAAWWAGPTRGAARRKAAAVLDDRPLSAAEHRRAAERLAAAGDFAAAVIERVRAIAVDLEERGIVLPRPGRTAAELAAEAAAALPPGVLPGGPARLGAAARLFEDIRYGGRPGTLPAYEQVRDLDEAIRSLRAASVTSAGGQPAARPAPEPAGAGQRGPGAW
jgi:Domain of unknown function (DUF4129)